MNDFMIATTTFEIQDSSGIIQLTPIGHFRAVDGRPREPELEKGWYVDKKVAAEKILQKLSERKNPLVVDYNHASLIEGHEAPAAGWMHPDEIYWEDEGGLKAKVQWTERAKESIEKQEHKFISPVFIYNIKTGHIEELINAALTNTPALDGMSEVALSLYFQNQHHDDGGVKMTSDILYSLAMKSDTLFNLVNLPTDAGEQQVIEAIQALLAKIRAAEEAAMAANQKFLSEKAVIQQLSDILNEPGDLVAAVKQIKNKNENATVPKALLAKREAVIESLKLEITKSNEDNIKLQRDAIIKQAQAECKLPEDVDSEEMQYALARPTLADLKDYISVCKPNHPPGTTQTGGVAPRMMSASLSHADPRSVVAAEETRKLARERGISLEQACIELAVIKENL